MLTNVSEKLPNCADKFNLPALVLDRATWKDAVSKGESPLASKAVVIMSYAYAQRMADALHAREWDLVVFDEAHKLRNAYRPSSKIGQAIRHATEGRRKLLLTATPFQNSVMELFGLASFIDPHIFGDVQAFRSRYTTPGSDMGALRQTLAGFCQRTLRRQVSEYVRYTARKAFTQTFRPRDDEHSLYKAVSEFLQRPPGELSYAIPRRQRHLTQLILRKLLASSSLAIAGTLRTMVQRLQALPGPGPARFRRLAGLFLPTPARPASGAAAAWGGRKTHRGWPAAASLGRAASSRRSSTSGSGVVDDGISHGRVPSKTVRPPGVRVGVILHAANGPCCRAQAR